MRDIKDLFGGIQRLFVKEVAIRTAIREAIKKISGVDVPIQDISFKGGTVLLKNRTSAELSTIFIVKGKIIAEANSLQEGRPISDIR